ncbi:hypothetical protein BCON_0027g00380 [Botryotinia convoluta]|uniref:Uncharacterized protein n=1 Tax=Botryotinia convoluta TaxID=54673 RepID=A0A4Z1IIP7_9HELO|nr:hypothetical protein BCON_0027g00380 [Botryotinia convoluta]
MELIHGSSFANKGSVSLGEYIVRPFTGYFVLMYYPHFSNANVTGIISVARDPNKLLSHPRPNVSYIYCPKRESTAPITLLKVVFAAKALAAKTVNASITPGKQ